MFKKFLRNLKFFIILDILFTLFMAGFIWFNVIDYITIPKHIFIPMVIIVWIVFSAFNFICVLNYIKEHPEEFLS